MTRPSLPRGTAPGLAVLGAAFLFALGWLRWRQGIDLSDQGLWVLGTEALARGHAVHAHLETGDGPLRYWLLRPFAAVAGGGFLGWVALQATVLALAGGAIGALWRRAGAWSLVWIAALMFVGTVPLAAFLALATGAALWTVASRSSTGFAWFLGGFAVVVTASVDPRWGVVAALLAAGAVQRGGSALRARDLLVGALATVALGHVAATVHGVGPEAWRNTWTLGFARLLDHLSLSRAGTTLHSGAWLHQPFAELDTGESLGAAWPAQVALRAWSLRLAAVASLVAPLFVPWRAPRARAGSLVVFVATAWLWGSGGDVPSLRLGMLLAVPLVLLCTRGTTRRAWSVGLALTCLPMAAEFVWLAATGPREGVSTWPRAGVQVTDARQERWESVANTLAPLGADPVLVWPSWPGLHTLLGLEPATRFVSLDRARPRGASLADLIAAVRPEAVLLEADPRFAHALDDRELGPAWNWMRGNYRIALTAAGGTDRFRVLRRVLDPETTLPELSLAERLAAVELTVANERSPALRRRLSIGQGFDMGPRDLEGFALRWSTRGRDLELKLRVRVWQRRGSEYDVLLDFQDLTVTVAGDGDRTWIRYPLEDTAGLPLAITVEVQEDPAEEVRLYWHRNDAGDADVDLYPQGSAILDLKPVEADLFFVAY